MPHTPSRPHQFTASAPQMFGHCLEAAHHDLELLEQQYGRYLEQEELRSDVQCLRSWIEACQAGDNEALGALQEHGAALLDNIKQKLQTASREIQRIDEESPSGCNFTGAKPDKLNKAACTALHAEAQLAQAFETELPPCDNPVITK